MNSFWGNKQQQDNKQSQYANFDNDPFGNIDDQQPGEQIRPSQRNNPKKPNPFGDPGVIGQRSQNDGQFGFNIQQNFNSQQMQESIYVQEETGLSFADSPAMQAFSNNQGPAYQCRCGKIIRQQAELRLHMNTCPHMQQDGYAQVVTGIDRLLQSNGAQYSQLSPNQKAKINNLQAIFDMMVPKQNQQQQNSSIIQNRDFQMNQIEEDKHDPKDQMMMIDSSSKRQGFAPPYQEQKAVHGDMQFEDFMDPAERQRAQTYYQQMQREAEERTCKYCDKQITDSDMQESLITMLQSTECFHQVHVECLRLDAVKKKSENQSVKCPKCQAIVQDWELNEYYKPEDIAKIEKNQRMQIVKINQNFVQCSCDNIMELLPGDIIQGQKDDAGKLLSPEAARHMANYRIKCNECHKNFCTQCKQEPYHVGKSCDQAHAKACRYCQEELKQPSPSMKPAFRDVCRKPDCFNLMQESCDKMLPCGHPCYGSASETKCLPCLEPDCIAKMPPGVAPKENKDDYCNICWCSALGQAPSARLACGHIYHVDCLKQQIQQKWNGPRIVFNYLNCPQCKQRIKCPDNPEIQGLIDKDEKLEQIVIKKALDRAKFEELAKDEKFNDPSYVHYKNLQSYALYKLSYYQCFKCQEPYFGGKKDCEMGQNDYNSFKREELVCGKCSAVAVGGGVKNCPKHGTDFIEFKCKFCCSIAQWFCWGNTHFCEPCHKKQCNGDYVSRKPRDQLDKCPGKKKCPLKVQHPPNGEEYALGCSICRNMAENAKDF